MNHKHDGPVIELVTCKAAIINHKGQLLLLRRTEDAPRRPLEWDLAGGLWEKGSENFEQALKREVHEETGMDVRELWLHRAIPELMPDKTFSLRLLYIAKVGHDKVELSSEHDMFTWAGIHDIDVYELPLHQHAVAVAALKQFDKEPDRATS